MNRLAPLIRRPTAIAVPMPMDAIAADSSLLDDLRFFALVWAGGFIFFGTLFA